MEPTELKNLEPAQLMLMGTKPKTNKIGQYAMVTCCIAWCQYLKNHDSSAKQSVAAKVRFQPVVHLVEVCHHAWHYNYVIENIEVQKYILIWRYDTKNVKVQD